MSMATEPGWHRGDWMQTWTGRQFYPLDPKPEDVDPRDIAHHLSLLCRYAGAVDTFYSVAEHCVHLCDWFLGQNEGLLALEALLHDATEAYVVDVPRPLKRSLPDYRRAEAKAAVAIAVRFGQQMVNHLGVIEAPEVKEADTRILLDERAVLMSNTRHEWEQDSLEPLGVDIEGWAPQEAEDAYLHRLALLGIVVSA